jgi:hypothetical protein
MARYPLVVSSLSECAWAVYGSRQAQPHARLLAATGQLTHRWGQRPRARGAGQAAEPPHVTDHAVCSGGGARRDERDALRSGVEALGVERLRRGYRVMAVR